MSKKNTLTKSQAIDKLWRMGNLEWKLKGIQKEMRRAVYESEGKKTVFLVGRRSGKSYTMMTIAVEYCIRNPHSIVKVIFPKKKDAKQVAREHMVPILSDCPVDIKPEWKEADKIYLFQNGSQIQMTGTDGGSAESVRGSSCHLAILDEAGFHDYNDFSYIIQSIIMPTLLTTDGKMILASTPSKEPDHPFMVDYVLPAKKDGTLIEYTILDNPLISKEMIDGIASEYPGGKEDPAYLREFMLISDIKGSDFVIPEFSRDLQQDIIKPVEEIPAYYDAYVSCDPALGDLTAILFGFYDFINSNLVILDEYIIGGDDNNVTTLDIADAIKRKEKMWFSNPLTGELKKPFLRIIDNNNKFLVHDLNIQHDLNFIATAKDNKEAQINQVRMMLKSGNIIINPRCKNLIFHLQTARWNKKRTGFQRTRGQKDQNLKANHADALDALIYMVRNLDKTRNPYPEDYFDSGYNSFYYPEHLKKRKNKEKQELMKSIMNIKS